MSVGRACIEYFAGCGSACRCQALRVIICSSNTCAGNGQLCAQPTWVLCVSRCSFSCCAQFTLLLFVPSAKVSTYNTDECRAVPPRGSVQQAPTTTRLSRKIPTLPVESFETTWALPSFGPLSLSASHRRELVFSLWCLFVCFTCVLRTRQPCMPALHCMLSYHLHLLQCSLHLHCNAFGLLRASLRICWLAFYTERIWYDVFLHGLSLI